MSTHLPPAGDHERRPWSRAEQAAALGISKRWYQKLLARERAAEREGVEHLPYVPLVDAPTQGLHYRLDDDQASVLPDCPFRIGRPGTRRGWTVKHKDDRLTPRPGDPQPSPHHFRPNGIGRKKNQCVVG